MTAATPTIGIENADRHRCPPVLASSSGLLDPNSAFRYEHVPSGLVHGTVTDANDGAADRGRRRSSPRRAAGTTTTDADGTYTLRLRPGTYTLTRLGHQLRRRGPLATVVDEGDTTVDFSLDAAVGAVSTRPRSARPSTSATTTDRRPSRCRTPAPAPLDWEAKERDQGVIRAASCRPPDIVVKRQPDLGRQRHPGGVPEDRDPRHDPGPAASPSPRSSPTRPATRSTSNDVTTVRAGSDGQSIASMAIDFAPATPMDQVGGYVYFDTDQDPSTGLPGRSLVRQADPGRRDGVLRRPVRDSATGSSRLERRHRSSSSRSSTRDDRRPHRSASTCRSRRSAATTGSSRPRMVVGLHRPVRLGAGRRPRHDRAVQRRPVAAARRRSPARSRPGGTQVVTLNLGDADAAARRVPRARRVRHERPQADAGPGRRDADRDAAAGVRRDHRHRHRRPYRRSARRAPRSPSTRRGRARRSTSTATTADDGTYSIVGPAGTWPADYSLDGYVPVSQQRHDRPGRHDLRRRRRSPQDPAACHARRRPRSTFVLHAGSHRSRDRHASATPAATSR